MGSHLCTGGPWVNSVLTHGQPLILPMGNVPTAHWWCCGRPWVIGFHVVHPHSVCLAVVIASIAFDLFHSAVELRCTISQYRRRAHYRCIRNGVMRSCVSDGAEWHTRGRADRWSPRTDATPRPFSSTTTRSCWLIVSHSKGCACSSEHSGTRSSFRNTVATRGAKRKRSGRCIRWRNARHWCQTLARTEDETWKTVLLLHWVLTLTTLALRMQKFDS